MNRRATPRPSLRFKQKLPDDRPCFPNADPWDEKVTKGEARAVCAGCPAEKACARTAVIDKTLVYADSCPSAWCELPEASVP
ncbi:hypothetical protein OHA25_50735 [Nonomuraea sp. NBC_00507]|uniref:hypothetical protein n=1 Tax=Nonomuraea sp. NBC_00507 TaxID=2976002 RepID=UPI002E17A7B5